MTYNHILWKENGLLGKERGFFIQMVKIKQGEAFSKWFGSIGPTSGSKGLSCFFFPEREVIAVTGSFYLWYF